MKARLALVATGVLVAVLAGCSHNTTKKKNDKPVKLQPIHARFEPRKAWSASMGGGLPKLELGLSPAIDGGHVYAAGAKGEVRAFDLATGRGLWQQQLKKLRLSAGPGVGQGLVVVGSSGGALVALDAANGAQRWRVQLNSELLSAPAVGGGLVVVRTVDGKLVGLEAKDGTQRWVVDQQVPRLTLRGTARPVLAGDMAIAGFDNGRMMAVSLASGNTAWDIPIGQPRGSSELQRLIDADAPPVVDGDDVFAVTFNGRAVRVARETGHEQWTHDISSYRGLAVDADAVYVATGSDEIVRLDRSSGAQVWKQAALERRALGAPVLQGGYVVTCDIQGVIHWLDRSDGTFVARAKGGARISNAPVASGPYLVVQTDKGQLEAWRTPGG